LVYSSHSLPLRTEAQVHAHIHPSSVRFTVRLSQGSVSTVYQASASHDGVVHWAITVPRAPSPEGRCYLPSAQVSNLCRQALPRLYRSYWLMRQTSVLSQPRFHPCTMSLCRLLRAPAGPRPFPALSPQSLCRCLDPYPVAPLQCACSLLPAGQRPHLRGNRFGMHKNTGCNATSTACSSRGCSHSITFRLPHLLDPPVAPTAARFTRTGQPGRLHHA
jgi:hypothetical protein